MPSLQDLIKQYEEIEKAHFEIILYLDEQRECLNNIIKHSLEVTQVVNFLVEMMLKQGMNISQITKKGTPYLLRELIKEQEEMRGKLEHTFSTLKEHLSFTKKKGAKYKYNSLNGEGRGEGEGV